MRVAVTSCEPRRGHRSRSVSQQFAAARSACELGVRDLAGRSQGAACLRNLTSHLRAPLSVGGKLVIAGAACSVSTFRLADKPAVVVSSCKAAPGEIDFILGAAQVCATLLKLEESAKELAGVR